MPITSLPTAPDPSDPATFDDRAAAWAAALDPWTDQANALEENVEDLEASAAASAASAIAAPGTSATSTTSMAIGTGTKTPTIQTGKSWVKGQYVLLAHTSAVANWMHGQITDYDSGTGLLSVNVTMIGPTAAGTYNAWTVSLSAPNDASNLLPKSGGAMTGNITDMGAGSTVKDSGGTAQPVGYRDAPVRSFSSAHILALLDSASIVFISTGGVTVPATADVAFPVGTIINIINNSGSSQTITQASGVTLRQAGTGNTGNRTIGARGDVTVKKVATNEWYIGGVGLT